MIFPDDYELQEDYETDEKSGTADLFEPTDWALNMTAEPWTMALKDGKPYMVTGIEALRQWVKKALMTPHARYAYSAEFGSTLDAIAPSTDLEMLKNAIKTAVIEALAVSPYIDGVDGFSFLQCGNAVSAAFSVRTIYGDIQEEVTTDVGI